MIFKLQRSLSSSDGIKKILVYNQDRSIMFEEVDDPSYDVIFPFGQMKVFVTGEYVPPDLDIYGRLPDQGW